MGLPGARNTIFLFKLMLLSSLLSSDARGRWDGESAKKTLDMCRGPEEQPTRFEKLGVSQAPGYAKTPPSGLEGGVGRPTRQLAFCLQPTAPGWLVSGWGVLSQGSQ